MTNFIVGGIVDVTVNEKDLHWSGWVELRKQQDKLRQCVVGSGSSKPVLWNPFGSLMVSTRLLKRSAELANSDVGGFSHLTTLDITAVYSLTYNVCHTLYILFHVMYITCVPQLCITPWEI